MCDFSGKLIAWLDRELRAENAAEVERHLELCAECRSRVEEYRHVTAAFDRYCDAYCETAMASRLNRKQPRRVVARWEAAALVAAAIAAMFLFVARAHVELSPAGAAPIVATPGVSSVVSQTNQPADGRQNTQTMNVSAAQRGRTSASPEIYDASGLAGEAAVEIAIPADAILPPGAVPEGVSFGADVTIAPDGSAQQIRLTPQLTEFERRSSLP
jgi:anti-sigma factor RsiW